MKRNAILSDERRQKAKQAALDKKRGIKQEKKPAQQKVAPKKKATKKAAK